MQTSVLMRPGRTPSLALDLSQITVESQCLENVV